MKLGQQAAAPNSPFSLSDKIGLLYDALALAKAGYASVGGALSLTIGLRGERERKFCTTPLSEMVVLILEYRPSLDGNCRQLRWDGIHVVGTSARR